MRTHHPNGENLGFEILLANFWQRMEVLYSVSQLMGGRSAGKAGLLVEGIATLKEDWDVFEEAMRQWHEQEMKEEDQVIEELCSNPYVETALGHEATTGSE